MVAKNKNSRCRKNSSGGFSLIEVAIALMIIGLLIVPLLHTYRIYIEAKQISNTKAATGIVNSALIKYVAKYGHYPIPSDPDIPLGAAGAGQQATEPGTGWPACTATSTKVCSTTTNTFAGKEVLIGGVPFAALGIPFTSQLDGYGAKLTYAITEILTSNGTYDEAGGGIEARDDAGKSIYFVDANSDSIDDLTTPRSHFFIMSHGQDRKGSFSIGGAKTFACGTAADGLDFENCNNDGLFNSNYNETIGKGLINDSTGAQHFDDVVVTNNTAASGIWTFVPNTPNIEATNEGNIYIGACASVPCIPKSKIDVNGNVRADIVKATRLCNYTSPGCVDNYTSTYFPAWWGADMLVGAPAALSETLPPAGNTWNSSRNAHNGAGIRCVGDRALRGIKNYDEEHCNSASWFSTSTAVGSCPTGEFPKGLDSTGKLICQLP
ncbi:MAG: type II secretion system protein [Alphaproteobacteria bacterium]|nr:type II secretion system protein [Alphaproteobacteria bacterium]